MTNEAVATPGEDTPVLNLRLAIDNAIKSALGELHTTIPGIVVKYDPATQTADVQVAIKRRGIDGTVYQIPPIRNVPVVFPRCSFGTITFPIATDDPVLIMFSERPLDRWRQSGGVVDPGDHRFFHQYTDAFCIPGAFPDSDPVVTDAGDGDGICIQSADSKIVIRADGKIHAGKRGAAVTEPWVLGQVLLNYLGALHGALETVLDDLSTGPLGIGNMGAPVPTDPALVAKLTAQKVALESARSQYVDTASTNVVSQVTFTNRGGA